jgi:uncharacterized protein (DUF305 family)
MRDIVKASDANRWTGIMIAVVVVMATVLAVAALAARDTTSSDGMRPSRKMHQGSGATPGWSDRDWSRMMDPIGVAGEPDYLAEMVAHHQEAVKAAGELARSNRPDLRAFGEAIVRTQSAQIQQMESWLRTWYPNEPAADYQPMMRDLSGLAGDELDRAFLQDMIGHHMAAVMMSQHLLRTGTEHDDVARLARSIRDDQHAEIIRMQRWLSEWFDDDWQDGTYMMMWGFQP